MTHHQQTWTHLRALIDHDLQDFRRHGQGRHVQQHTEDRKESK